MRGKELTFGIVMGTRPEIIKNYSIVKALKKKGIKFYILHTNQHNDNLMHQSIFRELKYKSDFVFKGAYKIGSAIDWVCRMVQKLDIDIILVNGDTASALVGAIAAVYTDVGLAHIEAGLRSFDKEMYEERNRIMVDAASHYLFTYTEYEKKYLSNIPDLRGKIYNVGNTTIDFINDYKEEIKKPEVNNYIYVTLHRKEFTDRKSVMIQIFSLLNELASKFEHIIYPMHPRTRDVMKKKGIPHSILKKVCVLKPFSAIDSICYIKYADVVITDSGCIQEEAYILDTPCITVRENTERIMTVNCGANIVTGFDSSKILDALDRQLCGCSCNYDNIYGQPGAGERIVDTILCNFRNFRCY